MKKRSDKQRIPSNLTANLVQSVRDVRARATPPRTPEEHRKAQILEHHMKQTRQNNIETDFSTKR